MVVSVVRLSLRINVSYLRQVYSRDYRLSVMWNSILPPTIFNFRCLQQPCVSYAQELNIHNAVGSSDEQDSSERLEITSSETSTFKEMYQGPAYQFENCDPSCSDVWHLLSMDQDQQQRIC